MGTCPIKPLTNDPEWACAVEARGLAYYPDLIGEDPVTPPYQPRVPHVDKLSFDTYERIARRTALYPAEHAILYPALGLAEEAGEVAGKIKRWLRGDCDLKKDEVVAELGDVLWYIAAVAFDTGVRLEDVAQANLDKLRERFENNTIRGTGDDR